VRGYLIRLGQALDFDGEAWWQRIKSERNMKSSGTTDSLPANRYLKKSPTQLIVIGVVALVVLIYLAFQLPRIIGKPSVAITDPAQNPFTASVSPITIQGTTRNADSLFVNGESVPLNPDGTWQKDVLLSNGPNEITVSARKFLGRSTDMTEEVVYEAPAASQPAPTSTNARGNTPSSTSPTASSTR
jgi:hypothetical protein